MVFDKQISQYEEVIEKLEDLLGELSKADVHFGLTDVQSQSIIQLKSMYDVMADDVLDLERQ
jgi:hypothetical protein